MAYIRKLKTGYRAEVERKGVRASKVFDTKAAAKSWAIEEEARILKESGAKYPTKTLAEAINRYVDEVSIRKKSYRAERLRFEAVKRDFPEMCAKVFHEVDPSDIAAWRDGRRKEVSDSSVVREAGPFRNLWNVARDEWGWCGESPWKKVKMPKKGHARTRRTQTQEIQRLVRSMGYVTGKQPTTPQKEVAYAYLVAHHTALRAGEVISLKRSTST